MTELDKMKRAHMYISKLADGVDPLTDRELPEDTLLNNVRMARCFFYVADVLDRVIQNGGEVGRRKRASRIFEITPRELAEIRVSQEAVAVTQLCGLISAAKPEQRKLSSRVVTDWLAEKGFLRVETVNNRKRKRVSPQGEQVGIFEELRQGANGQYRAVLYAPAAQQFVIDNLPDMLAAAKAPVDGAED